MPYNDYYAPFHFLVVALFWILVISILMYAIRGGRGRRHWMWDEHYHHMHRDPGMDILKERYAKGEITKEEFESKKKDLMS